MDAAVGAWWCANCKLRLLTTDIVEPRPQRAEVVAEAAAKAALGAFGPLGTFLAEAAFGLRNQRTLSGWAAAVDRQFAEAGRIFNPDDPIAMAYFNRLALGALQTHRNDQRELLASALLKVGEHSQYSDALQRRFVDLTIRLTPEHIRLLAFIQGPEDWLRSIGADPGTTEGATLLDAFGWDFLHGVDEPGLVLEALSGDLRNERLVRDSWVTYPGNAQSSLPINWDNLPSDLIEPLGLRFLAFLGGG